MRIQVSDGERNIRLWLPTNLVFSRLTALIGSAAMNKYTPEYRLTTEQIDALFAEFRRVKKKYGSWELVDVQSEDGEVVNVIL